MEIGYIDKDAKRRVNLGFVSKGKLCHTLEEMLQARNMKELRELAKQYMYRGYSRLDKATLISELLLWMTMELVLETVLSVLDEANWIFFQKAVKEKELIDDEAFAPEYMMLKGMGILGIYDAGMQIRYIIPREIRETYGRLERNGFAQRMQRIGRLREYVEAAVNLYGVISKVEFVELFNHYNEEHTNIREVSSQLVRQGYLQQHYCVWRSYFVSSKLRENDFEDVEFYLDESNDKPRYMPDREEFLAHSDPGYVDETEQLQNLREFVYELTQNSLLTDAFMVEFNEFHHGGDHSFQEYIAMVEEIGLQLDPQSIQYLQLLIIDLTSHSRRWTHKGHTPLEILAMERGDAGSMDDASDLAPAQTTTQKFGRNEPCPCGSGKKFKRCCGNYLSIV